MKDKIIIFFSSISNWVLTMLILFILASSLRDCVNKERPQTLLIPQDSLIYWKSKDSLNHYKINSITTENTKAFLELRTKDKQIQELQRLAKQARKQLRAGGSIAIFREKETYSIKIKNNLDTSATKIDSIRIYPVYRSKFNLKGWAYGYSIASIDSTYVYLRIKNEYIVKVIPDDNRLFRKQTAYVEIVNKNPYSEVTGINSYQVAMPKPKKFSIGIVSGYGLTSQGFSPFIGIGVSYSIVRF